MDYIAAHKKLLGIFVVILVVIPLSAYLWQNSGPKPGSCLVLEEKYCKNFTTIKNPRDPNRLLAVAKLPSGAILFSPAEGLFSDTPTFFFEDSQTKQITKYPGATVIVSKDGTSKTVTEIFSLIYYKKGLNTDLSTTKKGEVLGTVSDKTIDFLGDYNLVIGITKQNLIEGKAVFTGDNDQLKSLLKIK